MRPSARFLVFFMALCLSWQGLAGALSAAETVRTRGNVYPDYGRLVFDWPAPVGYQVEQGDGELVVRFERAGDFDLAKALARLAPMLGKAEVAPSGLAVTIRLKGAYSLKHFPLDKRVVIDLYNNQPVAEANEAAEKKSELKAAKADSVVKDSGEAKSETKGQAAAAKSSLAAAAPHKPAPKPVRKPEHGAKRQESGSEPAATEQPSQTASKVTGAPTSILPQALVKKPEGQPVSNKPDAGSKTAAGEGAAAPTKSRPVGRTALSKAVKSKISKGAKSADAETSKKSKDARVPGQGRLQILPQPMVTVADQPAIGPLAVPIPPVMLRFTWDQPTAVAAFRYGGDLWLAFDRELGGDLAAEFRKAAPAVTGMRHIEIEGASVLRLRTASFMVPRLTREDNAWMIDIRRRAPLPETVLPMEISGEEEDVLIRFPVADVGRLLWLTDPETGERLVIVPVASPGAGVASTRRLTQFEAISSQQGVVLLPLSDSLEVATARTGVLVRDREGLIVSNQDLHAGNISDGNSQDLGLRLFKLAEWRRGDEDSLPTTKKELMAAAVSAEGRAISQAHLDLARFYFAWGLSTEAMGLLRVVETEEPLMGHDPEFLLMRAVNAFLMDDYEAAGRVLAEPALAGEREAILWQAALAAASEDWQAAANGFALSESLIHAYPVWVRNRLLILAAEARLGIGDTGGANEYLVSLTRGELRRSDASQAKYLLGRRFFVDGEFDLAEKIWRELENDDHPGSRAKARLGLLNIELRQDRIDNDTAIERLEGLRFAWRGDDFELSVLARLAELYVEGRRFDKALQALQKSVVNFPNSGRTQALAQRMREVYTQVFLDESHPTVPPVRALAIYQEFRELTPSGEDGEKVISRLADRLVEVDLLDKAAELLQEQMQYRLTGTEKARVGARLALVRLMDREATLGLTALDESQVPDMPEELQRQRRHLRARALSELERNDEALVLLAGDDSLDAVRLRAEVLWSANDWRGAALALGRLIPERPPETGLTEMEANRIMNYAIALTLSDDMVGLISLNKRYAGAMASSKHNNAFRLLADDVDTSGFRSIAEGLGRIESVQAFMASYRDRIRDGSLSGVN